MPQQPKTSSQIFLNSLKKNSATGLLKPKQDASIKWLRNAAQNIQTTPEKIFAGAKNDAFMLNNLTNDNIGEFFLFNYQAKGEKDLPYYDQWPADVLIAVEGPYFMCLNFHYIPPHWRAILLDALYDLVTNDKYDRSTKLKITYQLLKGASKYRYFLPCLKKYRFDRVRSRFLGIHPISWEVFLYLPLAKWSKGTSNQQVWNDSAKIIQRQMNNLYH